MMTLLMIVSDILVNVLCSLGALGTFNLDLMAIIRLWMLLAVVTVLVTSAQKIIYGLILKCLSHQCLRMANWKISVRHNLVLRKLNDRYVSFERQFELLVT